MALKIVSFTQYCPDKYSELIAMRVGGGQWLVAHGTEAEGLNMVTWPTTSPSFLISLLYY